MLAVLARVAAFPQEIIIQKATEEGICFPSAVIGAAVFKSSFHVEVKPAPAFVSEVVAGDSVFMFILQPTDVILENTGRRNTVANDVCRCERGILFFEEEMQPGDLAGCANK